METKHPKLPIKEVFIKRLIIDLGILEKTVRTVLDDAFTNALKATATHKTIELSGFGVFHFNEKKAIKILEKYKSQIKLFSRIKEEDASETKRKNAEAKLIVAQKNFELLYPRINE